MDQFDSGAYGTVTSDRLGCRQRLVQLAMLAEDTRASGLIRPWLGSR